MREQERRRRSPDPAAKVKGKSKKKAVEDDGEEEEEEEEEEAEPVLQSDGGSSTTPPPAKRPRKGKSAVKSPTIPTKSKAPGWKAAAPVIGASKSKRTRTRSRATINILPPPEPVLHQEPAIDPQLEEYDAVIQAGYPITEMQHDDYSLPITVIDPMQAVSGWEPDPDLDALARAYIQDHE